MNHVFTLCCVFTFCFLVAAGCRTTEGADIRFAPDQHSTEIARIEDAVSGYGSRVDAVTENLIRRTGEAGTTARELESLILQYFESTQLLLYHNRRLQEYIATKGYRTHEFDQVLGGSDSNPNYFNPP